MVTVAIVVDGIDAAASVAAVEFGDQLTAAAAVVAVVRSEVAKVLVQTTHAEVGGIARVVQVHVTHVQIGRVE